MDWIIGGKEQVGPGLAHAGGMPRRGPLDLAAVASRWPRASSPPARRGAYSRVRSQFKTPIGKFEGVEEPLARIGGNTYMMDATRRMTMVALDSGEKPSVISAICKYHMTERMRSILNDAMDIHGGKGIMMGPNNYLGHALQRDPDRDHGRGRQHPHALADHLRPGRDPLPSVRAEGDSTPRARTI